MQCAREQPRELISARIKNGHCRYLRYVRAVYPAALRSAFPGLIFGLARRSGFLLLMAGHLRLAPKSVFGLTACAFEFSRSRGWPRQSLCWSWSVPHRISGGGSYFFAPARSPCASAKNPVCTHARSYEVVASSMHLTLKGVVHTNTLNTHQT